LGDHQPVKGIVVMKRQPSVLVEMGDEDGQDQDVGGIQTVGKELVEGESLPSESLMPISHSVAGLTKIVFAAS
jgi:hypothetical protein